MSRDTIMKKLWIFQDSKNTRFLHMECCTRFWIWLNNTLWQGSEYVWSTFHRALNKPPVLNIVGLRIVVNMRLSQRVLNMPEWVWVRISLTVFDRVLNKSQYVWIYLNNTEYDFLCQHIPEKTVLNIPEFQMGMLLYIL